MNVVQPIKKIEDIQKIKKYLAKKPRDALLFSFGINTGLRISDILSLDVFEYKKAVAHSAILQQINQSPLSKTY